MQTTKVTFIYDEPTGMWEVEVSGAKNRLEALQAFNAVIITAQAATPEIRCNEATMTKDFNTFLISVGVYNNPKES